MRFVFMVCNGLTSAPDVAGSLTKSFESDPSAATSHEAMKPNSKHESRKSDIGIPQSNSRIASKSYLALVGYPLH